MKEDLRGPAGPQCLAHSRCQNHICRIKLRQGIGPPGRLSDICGATMGSRCLPSSFPCRRKVDGGSERTLSRVNGGEEARRLQTQTPGSVRLTSVGSCKQAVTPSSASSASFPTMDTFRQLARAIILWRLVQVLPAS